MTINQNNEILRVEIGSTAHGTGLERQEDRDELSIVVETPEQIYGLDKQGLKTKMIRTQPEGVRSGPGDLDLTVYSLRTFLSLAASGNPSVLSALWAPVIESTSEGGYLLDNRLAFIGRHVIPRYRGYMHQQGLRLLGLAGSGHGHRGGGRYTADNKFILFDISVGGDVYLAEDVVTQTAALLDIPRVPFIGYRELYTVDEIVDLVRQGYASDVADEFDPTFMAEGIVAKTLEPLYDNRGERVMFKLKARDFKVKARKTH